MRLVTLAALAVLAIALAMPLASSVGIIEVSQNQGWRPGEVEAFFAAVNQKDGRENLIVAATINEKIAGYAFWLIPVPSNRSRVSVGTFRQFPALSGQEVQASSEASVISIYKGMLAAQIYPLPILSYASPEFSMERILSRKNESNESMLNRVEALSAGAEVIPATQAALKGYFDTRRMQLPSRMDILEPYMREGNSFVIAWISNSSVGITRGISITYDSERAILPFATLRAYNKSIPLSVYMIGRYALNYSGHTVTNESIALEYYSQDQYTPPVPLRDFFFGNASTRLLDFTKITVYIPPEDARKDLEFSVLNDERLVFLDSLRKHPYLWGLLIYAVLSCFASLIAGIIVFHEYRPKPFKFFFFGFTNLFTLIGFWTLAYYSEIEKEFTELENIIDQQVDLTAGQRAALLTPIILLIVIMLVIPATIFLELGSLFMPIFMSNLFAFVFIPALIFLILALWGKFLHKRILVFNVAFAFTFLTLLVLSLFGFLYFI